MYEDVLPWETVHCISEEGEAAVAGRYTKGSENVICLWLVSSKDVHWIVHFALNLKLHVVYDCAGHEKNL